MSHFLSVRYRCLLAAGMGLLVNYTAEARAQSASPAPLPIAVMLRPIEGDEHTAGTLAWLGDAITGAISDAGMAAISRSPLALTVRVSSRSAGQSDAGMRRVVRSEVSLLFTVHLASANGMAGSVRLTRFGTGRDAGSASASAVQSLTSEPELIASAMLQLARDAERTSERSCGDGASAGAGLRRGHRGAHVGARSGAHLSRACAGERHGGLPGAQCLAVRPCTPGSHHPARSRPFR
jgi:hypothetical protein